MLDGIRVLDLSRVIAGPYAAMLLGDLGADVIKVERPGRGDDLRDWTGTRGSPGMSAVFAAVNRNKRGVAVDLQRPEGARLVLALARQADVLIENFVPGAAERLGVGYAAVAAVNPAIVYASVSGFGQTGPYARRPGYNTIAQGMSGLMALTGHAGGPPTRAGGSVADLAAAYLAFGAVCAALVHCRRTGRGQHLDVSLLAATLGLLPDPVAHYFHSRVRPRRVGNRNPVLTPAEAFRTADGHVNVVLMNPEQWDRFCRVLGDEVLRTEARFATNADRLAHHDEMRARVEAALAGATTAEWVARFEAASIAAGPIYELDEVFEDPQVGHLGLLAEVAQPGYAAHDGRVRMLACPVRASATPAAIRRPAPQLGEHTAEVLGALGLERAELDRLAAAGVIALGAPAPAVASRDPGAATPPPAGQDPDTAARRRGAPDGGGAPR
jgi:crotonobetainyl-CoA:carnitine CoA-transferase CaiB-like acyl-CoA transferase